MFVIGIDPGATGAITFLENDVVLDIVDMPIFSVAVGSTKHSHMNIPAIIEVLRGWMAHVDATTASTQESRSGIGKSYEGLLHAFIEQVGATPGKSPVFMFRFGEGFGILKGLVAALGIPVTYVHPAIWKRAMRCSREKDEARLRACEVFPSWAGHFAKVKDHNRAESALIGLYGIRQMRGEGYAPERIPLSERRR